MGVPLLHTTPNKAECHRETRRRQGGCLWLAGVSFLGLDLQPILRLEWRLAVAVQQAHYAGPEECSLWGVGWSTLEPSAYVA